VSYFITEKGARLLEEMGLILKEDYYAVLDAIGKDEEAPNVYKKDVVLRYLLSYGYINKVGG
jgi:hypothetical protein